MMFGFLGSRDITTSHEARVAQTAREMALAGWPWNAKPVAAPAVGLVDTPEGKRLRALGNQATIEVNPWAVPLLNGQIRLQKPPLPYWVAAIGYRVAGVGEGPARFGGAVLGVLCLPLMFDLARRLIGRRGAWLAAVVWVSSYFIADEFRKAMADPYLAFFTLLCFWAWVRGSEGLAGRWAIVVFYIGLGLGLLAKGPVLLLHVGLAVAAYHICHRRRAPRGRVAHFVGIVLLVLIAVPWPVYVIQHVPNAIQLWRYESIGELTGENVEKGRAWYFYLPNLVQLSLPWTVLWIAALVGPFVRRGSRSRRLRRCFPLAWYIATVVFFSFSTVKKNAYLLPMMPAQVLLIAQAGVAVMAMSRRARGNRAAAMFVDGQKLIGLVFAVGVAGAIVLDIASFAPAETTLASIVGSLSNSAMHLTFLAASTAALAIGAGLLPLVASSREQLGRWFFVQGICYSILLSLFLVAVATPLDNARSPKHFARIVANASTGTGVTISRARIAEAVLFYLPADLANDPGANTVLVVVEQRPKHPLNTSSPSFFTDDVPGRLPVSATELPVATASSRNPWRLYLVTARPLLPSRLDTPAAGSSSSGSPRGL
jgi:4-amino-4-deoxy-L-arabinose transferase-like glycosyltransferase